RQRARTRVSPAGGMNVSAHSSFVEPLLPLVREPDEAAALLSDLVMTSTEAAVVATDLEGRIVLWNVGASRMYGYSPGEAIGCSAAGILQPAADLIQTLEVAMRDGTWEGTASVLRPTGEPITARLVTTLRHNGAGEPVGFVFVSRDISTEVRLRAELRAAQLDNAELSEQIHRQTRELAEQQRDAFEATRMKSEFL